jgi:hypothetical protein
LHFSATPCVANGAGEKITRPAPYLEGTMLKISFIIPAAFLGMALADSLIASADPVTDADIRGKKICWTTGVTSTYGKDGSFDSNRSGHGTWTLVGDRLTVILPTAPARVKLQRKMVRFTPFARAGTGTT